MLYEIGNGILTAAVSSRGGELMRLGARGRDYLWNGDPAFWDGRSPNLFPVCGRTTGLHYFLDGREYSMPAHGFLKDLDLNAKSAKPDSVVFEYVPDEQTKALYPFDYALRIGFKVESNKLRYSISVKNTGERDMYFAWGGHPGFSLPLCRGFDFEDYSIIFSEPCSPVAMEITPDGYVGTGRTPVELEDGVRLGLRRSFFAVDGLFMTGACRSLVLDGPGDTAVGMEFPDCPTLGLWTACGGAAPFICIEPWSGTPDRAGTVCKLDEKPDMIRLKPGRTYRGGYSISIIAKG